MAAVPVPTTAGAPAAHPSGGSAISPSARLPALLVAASSSSLGSDRPPSPLTLSRPAAPLEHGSRPHDGNGGDSAVLLPTLMPPSGALGSVPVNGGWCSARMCKYPQWLVFSLSQGGSAPCSVSTVQILAHNFKIPSKISIMIPSSSSSSSSSTSSTAAADLDRISWVEYGHLVLSTNMSSNYRAREHLTVPTDIRNTSFIKLVLHSPYHNPLNLWRQVSLLQVRFHGVANAPTFAPPRAGSPSRQSTMIPPSNSHPLVSIAYAALEVLAGQKQQAVAHEDYVRAAEIKSQTDQVLDLVRQLQQCAQVPNDGSAGAEMWVRRLGDVESQLRAALGKVGTAAAHAVAAGDPMLSQSSAIVQAAEPVLIPAPSVSADASLITSAPSPVLDRSHSSSVIRAQSPAVAQPSEAVKLPALESNLPRLPSPAPPRTKSPPVPAVANRSRAESPNTSAILSSPNQTFTTDPTDRPSPTKDLPSTRPSLPRTQPRSKSRSRSRSPEAPPATTPTPPPPEPELSETQQVDYRLAIDWLGTSLVARFLAKDFATRDHAVQDILTRLDPAAWPAGDASVVVKGAFTLIDPSLADPRERVTGWALAMWSALVAALGGAGAGSGTGAVSMFTSLSSMHWAALIGRAADTNSRVAGPARQLAMALVAGWPATFVPLVLKGFPGTGPWRSAWARVVLVDDTVEKVGIAGAAGAGLGASVGRISPAVGEVAGAKVGLKKKPSVAARLGVLGRSSSASLRPSTPSKAAGGAAAPTTNAGSGGSFELSAIQEFLSRALSHTHAQVRDAAANLLVSVAKLVGAPAVWPVVDGLEQRSQVQTLRAKIEKYAPAPSHVHSMQSPVRNQQQQQQQQQMRASHQQPEQQNQQHSPSPPRHARHQSATHLLAYQAQKPAQPPTTAAPRPSSVQGMQAFRMQQPTNVPPPRKPQYPPAQLAQSTAPVSGLPQPTARPPSIMSLSDKKDAGKKDKEKKGFWDRLFNHSTGSGSGSKEGKKDKRASGTSASTSKPAGVSFAADRDPMGLLGSPPPHDTSFVSSSGAAAHAHDRTFDLGNSTIMSTASASGGPTAAGGQANETEGDWNLDFTCVFCEEVNPEFVQQRLDEHYWRECPCLSACAYCSEVVEVANMHTHLKLECKSAQAKTVQLAADTCVMCRARIGMGEAAFRRHLLVGGGCAKAVRKPKPGVKYRV